MEIVVKIGTDKSITLVVKASDTIASVQAKIYGQEGTPSEKQRLIFGEHA
jgi:ubiquitin